MEKIIGIIAGAILSVLMAIYVLCAFIIAHELKKIDSEEE